jgi:hypothetical protein
MPDDTVLLERHFDTAFAAPDGMQKLRELILTLAMQGKLVPQDPNDQPTGEGKASKEVVKTEASFDTQRDRFALSLQTSIYSACSGITQQVAIAAFSSAVR